MIRKFYTLLSGAKRSFFALVLTALTLSAYSQATYTFNYTGSIQSLTLAPGNYSITCWGALGGWHANDPNTYRGQAGFSTGTLSLTTTQTIYIAVGGAGGTQTNNTVPGGWNGGGNAKYYSYSYNGGGGASHVATATGTLGALSSNTAAVIIVAGGGGGGSSSQTPGNGGGMSGTNGTRSGCTGGTQTSPGASSISGGNAAFGVGWDGTPTSGSYGAGGGGWYGGGCESGGSGYIGGVTGGTTIAFGQTGYVSNPVTTGHGLVLITELCPMTFTAAGASSSVTPVICSGQSLTLTTNAVSNYSWSTGVTGTNQIIVSPTTNTVYTVTGTSSINCTTSRSMSVTVSSAAPVLTVSAVPGNSICLGDSVAISATGALTYTYSGGIIPGVKFAPTQNTSYTVTGGNGCGTSSVVNTITVSPLAVSIAASNTLVCASTISTLTASGAQSYTWYPQLSYVNPFNAFPSSNTNYTVIGKTGGCYGQATVQVNTKPNPTLTTSGSSQSICVGETATITVTGADSYTWPNTSLSGSIVVVSPSAPTAFTVHGTAANGCTGTAQYVLLAWPTPSLTASATPTQICVGASVKLQALGANGYTWAHGPTSASTTESPVISTNYVVVGTENAHGCSASATVAVDVFQATISVSSNTAVCPGGSVVLSAGAAASYTWEHGDNTQFTTVSPAATTVYTINATGQVNGMTCLRTNTIEVAVHPMAVITATAHRTTICKNETTTLTASGGVSYLWNTGATQPTVTFKGTIVGPVNFTVTGTDQNSCKDTHTLSLNVSNCLGIDEIPANPSIRIYPNPNTGLFTIESPAGLAFLITNALGEVVKRISIDDFSNGIITVTDLPKGVYLITSEDDPTNGTRVIIE